MKRTLLAVLVAAAPPLAAQSTCPAPVLIAPDSVSTAATEVRLAISPDGNWMLWGVIGRERGAGGWDIWERRRLPDGGWTEPNPVGFNSTANDFDPAFIPIHPTVLFFSNRDGGLGGDDLYASTMDLEQGTWSDPLNLGSDINTAGNEWAPVVSPDGLRLMFSSDGRGGAGGQDLFVAERVGDRWGAVHPVPGVNSAEDDFDAAFLPDGRIVFTRGNAEEGRMSLFVWDGHQVRRLGAEVNSEVAPTFGPSISPAEPDVLVFSSHHPGNVRGRIDLYRVGLCAMR